MFEASAANSSSRSSRGFRGQTLPVIGSANGERSSRSELRKRSGVSTGSVEVLRHQSYVEKAEKLLASFGERSKAWLDSHGAEHFDFGGYAHDR